MSGPLDVIGGGSAGGVISGAVAPSTPGTGTFWYDTTNAALKLWNGATWVLVSTTAGTGGVTVANAAPTGPTTGQLWYDPSSNKLQVYYNGVWIGVGGGAGGSPPTGATAPGVPTEGMLWYDSGTMTLKVYTGGSWVSAAGQTAVQIGITAPLNPFAGELWYDSIANTLKAYVGGNWVSATSGKGSTSGTTSPLNPAPGQIWLDTSVTPAELKVYNGTSWMAASGVVVRAATAGADQGSLQATFNADRVSVAPNEVLVYTYKGAAYIYTGPSGSPVAGATAGNFTVLGAPLLAATVAALGGVKATANPGNQYVTGIAGDGSLTYGPVTVNAQHVNLGTTAADIGAAWTALAVKPTVVGEIVTLGTFKGETYLLATEAAPATTGSWVKINPDHVVGPATSTDNAVMRFDGTTGKVSQNSGVIISDTNDVTIPGNLTVNGNATLGNAAADAVTVNASTMAIPNNLNIDTNTLMIDAAKNFVGVGTATPAAKLEVDNGTVTTAVSALSIKEIWNSATVMFTSIVLNVTKTLADASSELINLKVGGTSRFVVQERGYMKASSPTRDLFIVDAAAPDPVLQAFDVAGTSVFQVSSAGNMSLIGGVKTANIGTTVAPIWKLGAVKTGAATLDATRYIEVDIGGTVVKLAVVS